MRNRFVDSSNGLTLHEVRERLGLPKSSVHCLLVALERRGYLHRNKRTGRYRFGLRLFTLANMALSGLELRELAIPYLRGLMGHTGLTVHIAILEDDEAVLVDKVDPPARCAWPPGWASGWTSSVPAWERRWRRTCPRTISGGLQRQDARLAGCWKVAAG